VARRISGTATALALAACLLTPATAAIAAAGHPVAFRAADGVELQGRLFGDGRVGVVLAHGALEQGEDSWFGFAPVLAGHGLRVLKLFIAGKLDTKYAEDARSMYRRCTALILGFITAHS
jgi:hypothetical protein